MPARSQAQQEAIAIAEHHPEMLRKKNYGLLAMSKEQMHDYAATPRKDLPKYALRAAKPAAPK